MIDVVANNMAYAGASADVEFSSYTPFNDKEYFHDICPITNYSDPHNAQQVCLYVQEIVSITHKTTVLASAWSSISARFK